MKRFIAFLAFILPLVFLYQFVFGATFYVDCNANGDAGSGTTTAADVAWKTIAKVNSSSFSAGDSILFNKGCTWREQLNFPSSGSAGNLITFGSYGTGNKPKIYGSLVPSSWTEEILSGSAAPEKIQGEHHFAALADSLTVSYTNTPTEGNLLVAVARSSNSGATIDKAAISGWTLAISASVGTNIDAGIWYKVAGASESKDVSLTWTDATAISMIIEEWSNTTILDKTAKTDNSGAVSSKSSGTTASTTADNELCIAAFGIGNTTTNQSLSNSFNLELLYPGTLTLAMASKVVSSTGAQETTLSWTTARVAGGMIATFKGSGGADKTLQYTSQAADPLYVYFISTDGVIHTGNKVADKATLSAEYDWWFDDPNNRLYVYAATNPSTRYTSVEVPDIVNRTRGIWWGGTTNREYVAVNGFEVAFTPGVGIVVRGNSTVINNYIHHVGDETATSHSYGIEIQTGGNCIISNNVIHDTNSSGIYAVASYDPYTNSNNVIENNTVYDCYNSLILLNCRSGYTMQNNIIRNNYLYHSAGFSAAVTDYGISFLAQTGKTSSAKLHNNIVSTKRRAISIDDYSENYEIYNNAIYSLYGSGIRISGTGTSGNILKNNIVSGAGLYALQVVDASAISACDYNLWYAPTGTAYVLVGASAYHSDDFATYKSDTGWDAHGLWQDPLVVSVSDSNFRLQSTSPAINAGISVGLTKDIIGTIVPLGAGVDIGAYEYGVGIEHKGLSGKGYKLR
jgi:hypothetical protein